MKFLLLLMLCDKIRGEMFSNRTVLQVGQLNFNAYAPKASCNCLDPHTSADPDKVSTVLPLKIVLHANLQLQLRIFSFSLCHLLFRPADWYKFWKWKIKDIFK